MRDYRWLHEYCLNRFGSAEALEARLPVPASAETLRAVPDDRYLSQISLRVFRAGLKHSLVDAKWPAFEEAFFGFVPQKVVLMGAEHLERLMGDARLIRHAGKVVTHRQLLKEVWGPDSVHETHYLRVFMAQLRQKIEPDSARPRYLLTEQGVGYRLASE